MASNQERPLIGAICVQDSSDHLDKVFRGAPKAKMLGHKVIEETLGAIWVFTPENVNPRDIISALQQSDECFGSDVSFPDSTDFLLPEDLKLKYRTLGAFIRVFDAESLGLIEADVKDESKVVYQQFSFDLNEFEEVAA